VQQMRYEATFPLLLNIADQPTYFMALKGADGLVKMYAMVNVQQYQIVETGGTVAECEANYRKELAHAGLIGEEEEQVVESTRGTVSGVIEEIRTAVINGNSQYFLRISGEPCYYVISAAEDADVVVVNVGDEVSISFDTETAGTLVEAYEVTVTGLAELPAEQESETLPAEQPEEAPAEETEESVEIPETAETA